MKNPHFNREETILCLDLYFKLDYGQMHGRNPSIIQLSKDLNALGIHKDIPDPNNFRSVNSVALKLANLKRLDSNFEGRGMRMGAKMDRIIWNEFHKHRDTLSKEAELIRQLYLKTKPGTNKKTNDNENQKNYTSDFIFYFHKNKESDPLILKLKIEHILTENKRLKCEVCNFSPTSFYGELGNDLLEIHYIKEFKSMPAFELSNLNDFIIICSNCHKVLDKHYGLINAKDLNRIIKKK